MSQVSDFGVRLRRKLYSKLDELLVGGNTLGKLVSSHIFFRASGATGNFQRLTYVMQRDAQRCEVLDGSSINIENRVTVKIVRNLTAFIWENLE